MEWKSIETAPKDGTFVLVCGDYSMVGAIASWYPQTAQYLSVTKKWQGFDRHVGLSPTHWMPLPKPPINHGP